MASPEGPVSFLPSQAVNAIEKLHAITSKTAESEISVTVLAVPEISAATSKVVESEISVTAPVVPTIAAGKPASLSAATETKATAAPGENSAISVPVIDLAGLRSGDPEARARIVREIGEATEAWGFFQVVNHSVKDELRGMMHEQAKQFFGLPKDVKKRAQIVGANGRYFGYQGFLKTDGEETVLVKDSLADSRAPTYSLEGLTSKIWPGGNVTFSNTLEHYCFSVEALGRQLLELLAESVGVQTDFYSQHFTNPAERFGTWRLHHFPASAAPQTEMRTQPHTDPSVLTLLTEDVGALQVRKAGLSSWFEVERLPGSFVVNVGDILEAWSNGRFPSGEHQVILKENAERFSMVVFLDAWPTWLIKAPAELIDDEHPRLYRPFVASDFRANFENTKDAGDITKGRALDYVRMK